MEKIYVSWNKNQVASLLILDILNVYNHVCKIYLLHNLRKRRINLKIVGLIKSFLSHKTIIMKTYKCILDYLSIECGIPQESPLSPILFLFYNADFLDVCSSIIPRLSANAFIDNINLLTISPSTKKNRFNLAKIYKGYLEWAETYNAIFAVLKYQLVHLMH